MEQGPRFFTVEEANDLVAALQMARLEHPTTDDADLLYTATLFGTVTRYPTPMAKPRQRASHVCLC